MDRAAPYLRRLAPYLLLALRLVVGGVFIYASLHKIAKPTVFAYLVYKWDLLPDGLVNAFAIILPWVEITAGAALIAGLPSRAAALALAGILGMFIVAASINLLRGVTPECGCFSSKGDELSILLVIRNTLLLGAALAVVVGPPSAMRLEAIFDRYRATGAPTHVEA